MRWAGHAAYMREIRSAYKVFVEKPEGKRPHRKPGYRWGDIIKMDLRGKGRKVWTGFIWSRIGQVANLEQVNDHWLLESDYTPWR
jgi:hypothetical protein